MWGPSEYARNTSLDQEAKLLVRAASKGSIFQGQHLIVKEYNLVINRYNPERPSVAKQLEEKFPLLADPNLQHAFRFVNRCGHSHRIFFQQIL